ncbi:MAG TPA: hypothetical protein VGW40_13715 [Allosphingosinicella sp.]|nr:hypothetical protein [Allosphingosinicella sp.]
MSRPLDISPEDWARYRGLIKNIDMSDDQKDEVILIVRNIMKVFVDQAFGLDPVQLSLASQAKLLSQRGGCSANVSPSKEGRMPGGNLVQETSDSEGLSP